MVTCRGLVMVVVRWWRHVCVLFLGFFSLCGVVVQDGWPVGWLELC